MKVANLDDDIVDCGMIFQENNLPSFPEVVQNSFNLDWIGHVSFQADIFEFFH